MSGIESPFTSITVWVRLPLLVLVPDVPPKLPIFVCSISLYKSSPLTNSEIFGTARSTLTPKVVSFPSFLDMRTLGKTKLEDFESEPLMPSIL